MLNDDVRRLHRFARSGDASLAAAAKRWAAQRARPFSGESVRPPAPACGLDLLELARRLDLTSNRQYLLKAWGKFSTGEGALDAARLLKAIAAGAWPAPEET